MFTEQGMLDYGRLVAKSWVDPSVYDRLIANPRETLIEYGIEVPPNVVLTVNPGSSDVRVELGLPSQPRLSEEQIETMPDETTGCKCSAYGDATTCACVDESTGCKCGDQSTGCKCGNAPA